MPSRRAAAAAHGLPTRLPACSCLRRGKEFSDGKLLQYVTLCFDKTDLDSIVLTDCEWATGGCCTPEVNAVQALVLACPAVPCVILPRKAGPWDRTAAIEGGAECAGALNLPQGVAVSWRRRSAAPRCGVARFCAGCAAVS